MSACLTTLSRPDLTKLRGSGATWARPRRRPHRRPCPISCPHRTRWGPRVAVRTAYQHRRAGRLVTGDRRAQRRAPGGSMRPTTAIPRGLTAGALALALGWATASAAHGRPTTAPAAPAAVEGAAWSTSFEAGQPQPLESTVEVDGRRAPAAERHRRHRRRRQPARLGHRRHRERREPPGRGRREPHRRQPGHEVARLPEHRLGPLPAVRAEEGADLHAHLGQRRPRARPEGRHRPGLDRRHDVDRPRPPHRPELLEPAAEADLHRDHPR